jgi:sugar O-acyltransferase (sialic acid O-acetyltransferase NeuD family)
MMQSSTADLAYGVNMRRIVLFGCGGLALEVAEYLAEQEKCFEVCDIVSERMDRFADIAGVLRRNPRPHASVDSVEELAAKEFLVCVGDPVGRHKIFRGLRSKGARFGRIVHPTAWVASSSSVGDGVIVGPFAYIGPRSVVGDNCLLNVRATVGHDVVLGASVVLSPHVDVNGGAKCGDATMLGAGVIVDPRVGIGACSKVSSGSVVKRSFDAGFLLVGNPANGRRMFEVLEGG